MEDLLKLISDGEVHSGEEIGRALGVSRAAVWKKIKALETLGLRLNKMRGKGYRLASGVGLLNEAVIFQKLDKHILNNILLHTCLVAESTNDLVYELWADKLSNYKIPFCIVEHQTQGRGRRGRSWSSVFGSSICLSALWQLSSGAASLEGLSLAVGLCVLKALEFCGAQGLGLKWPNDILWQGRKLAGVLLEVHGDPTGDCKVVIGIGVNVNLNAEQLDAIHQPAVDMMTICGRVIDRNYVISAIINSLYQMLEAYKLSGFSLFYKQWEHYDVFAGKLVTLDVLGEKVSGRSLGVTKQGGLILETNYGEKVFHGGEVTLRAVS